MKVSHGLSITVSLVLAGALAGCGSTEPEDAGIVGFWFGCEFGLADNCEILDDDGHQFTADGMVYDIEESIQASETECAGSPCFRADAPSITVDRFLVGTYSYEGTSLSVTIDDDGVICTETVSWQIGSDPTQYIENCLDAFQAEDDLVLKYAGTVTVN